MNAKIQALKEQMGGFIARGVQRDSDTAFGWDNHGVLMYKVFHEWNDSYNPATGETGQIIGETYNSATDSFSVATTTGQPVFNGRLSGLWDLISQACPNEVRAMYLSMRSNGFDPDSLWEMYQGFKNQWCEALYNADAMGYANTGRFDMAYGDKSEAMRAIFRKRFRYLDSKYGANTAHNVVMRLWGNGHGIVLRHYCPIYASLNWGAGDVQTVRSVEPGQPAYFENPGVTFNDTTVTAYDADLITEISSYVTKTDGTREEGGLQDLGSGLLFSSGLDQCRRLKNFILDYGGGEPNTMADNKTLDVCNSVALRKLVVRNCPNVSGHPVIKSQVIEEIDFRQTPIAGITVPETDTLTTMRLGSDIQSLSLANMGSLENLTFEGVDKLVSLSIRNCPKLNGRATLEEALNNGVITSVSMLGVNWRNFDTKYLMLLAELKAEITGTIILPEAANMSFALKQKCLEAWGNVDDQLNPLYIGYTQRPVEIIRISGAGYFSEEGEYQLSVISDDPYANDFTKIKWEMTANNYADIDTLTGRVRVSRVGSEELAPTAEVTVTVRKSDGTSVSKTTTVGFYERSCKLGDYVYADGSFSDVYDDSRTVVAICFYIDPNDPTLRLGVAPCALPTRYAYGAGDMDKLELTDNPDYNNILVPGIPNNPLEWGTIPSSRILDEETKTYKPQPEGSLFRGGFSKLTSDVGPYESGRIEALGKIETYRIIAHRNKILRDSGINLPVPVKSDSESERDCLSRLIALADVTPGLAYKYYYPAGSYAYAYEPAVKAGETLAEKFKSHQWFLPAPGDMVRFGHAYSAGWFDNLNGQGWPTPKALSFTTGQFDTCGALQVDVSTGQFFQQVAQANGSKRALSNVFPMVQF